MIAAVQRGRELVITVEGIDAPLVVRPLPSAMGTWLTREYFSIVSEALPPSADAPAAKVERMNRILCIALDGGVWGTDENGQSAVLPLPDGSLRNWPRLDNELSLSEGRQAAEVAFFWTTVLGMSGVQAYLSAGGGIAGGTAAVNALVTTFGISPVSSDPVIDILLAIEEQAQSEGATP